jgi:hypothetical protein
VVGRFLVGRFLVRRLVVQRRLGMTDVAVLGPGR